MKYIRKSHLCIGLIGMVACSSGTESANAGGSAGTSSASVRGSGGSTGASDSRSGGGSSAEAGNGGSASGGKSIAGSSSKGSSSGGTGAGGSTTGAAGNPGGGNGGKATSGAGGATTGGRSSAGGDAPGGTGPSGGTAIGGSSAKGGATSTGGTATLPPAQNSYFVAPDGKDSNPGSLEAPFLTLAKARDAVRTVNASMTGDIYVYLRGGNYPLSGPVSFGPKDSGSGKFRITYQAYPGETPVLNGATQVTGWTVSSGNIYKAVLDRKTKLRNLYVNDQRAAMTKKQAGSKGGTGSYPVTSGQAAWAWNAGSGKDGINYSGTDVPAIASNKEDLEIVNGTTWNENIVCTRDVVSNSDGTRGLLLQQPYGAIAQLPNWGAGFSVTGTHTIYNAFEFLNGPGQFYFDKTAGTLYYQPRSGEDMSKADVEAPVAERLIEIAGTSTTDRVKNLTFKSITFANTDYSLVKVGDSYGKASVQAATVFIAYGSGDWHTSKYEIIDTLPAMINVTSADSIEFIGNVIKHSGNEGISMVNDVVNSSVVGNYINDMAGSGVTIGHPQHVYIGDGGTHQKYAKGVEGVCSKISVSNNAIYDVSTQPGFGGHAGVTAFFVESVSINHNYVHTTAYNGIHLGWGWKNFKDSTTCKSNDISFNRLTKTLNRLHDSGAIYTIGQMTGTTINQNYVKGIPPQTSGPTYGLHNDEGTAWITENDNILDIDTNVKYTINCEDYGDKHDLTILRTYATVSKMGANPPQSKIDPIVVVSDNVWPLTQCGYAINSGVEDAYNGLIPRSLLPVQDSVFPASCAAPMGTASVPIRSTGDGKNTVWFAPAGTTSFAEGPTMTKAAGDATTIAVPTTAGTYKLSVVDADGKKSAESAALLRVK
jgi:hypothetical protein